jgi:AraC-like DNA-binding protein
MLSSLETQYNTQVFPEAFSGVLRITNSSSTHSAPLLSESAMLSFVVSGAKRIYINNTRYDVSPDKGLFIPPNMVIFEEAIEEDGKYEGLDIGLSPQILNAYEEIYVIDNTMGKSFTSIPTVISRNKYQEDIIKLFAEFERNQNLTKWFNTKLKCLELVHIIQSLNTSPIIVSASKYHLTHSRLTSVMNQLVTKDFSNNDVLLSRIALLSGLSISSLKREFKKNFNDPVRHWLIQKRLERARLILKSSRLSIKEIGYDCGFNDTSYFIKQFKRRYGMTPLAWRESTE